MRNSVNFGLHQYSGKYALISLTLLIIEIFIALFVKDKIIRPYLGDLLVVILMYTCCKIFFQHYETFIAIAIFVFACCIEVLQYLHIVELMGLSDNKAAKIIIGSKFNVLDLVMYLAGIAIVLFVEKQQKKHTPANLPT